MNHAQERILIAALNNRYEEMVGLISILPSPDLKALESAVNRVWGEALHELECRADQEAGQSQL